MSTPGRAAVVCAKVENGGLPCMPPGRLEHGTGIGNACDGCGEPIRDTHVRITAHYDELIVFSLHASCFLLWRDMCERPSRT